MQSLAVTSDGVAHSWGWGESGSTGHGTRSHRWVPTPIEALRKWRIDSVSAGSGHSLFVTAEGNLYACGDCRYGKLGLGGQDVDVLVPLRVKIPKPSRGDTSAPSGRVRVLHASAWHAHSLAVTACGALYSFGCGFSGCLGHGDEENVSRPKRVRGLSGVRVRYASAGQDHSCALSDDGVVYVFGDCTHGATGRHDALPLLTPQPLALPIGGGSVVVSELAVGDHHTLVRTTCGEVLTFGNNVQGQLGLGSGADTLGLPAVAAPTRVCWPHQQQTATPASSSQATSSAARLSMGLSSGSSALHAAAATAVQDGHVGAGGAAGPGGADAPPPLVEPIAMAGWAALGAEVGGAVLG